MDETPESRPAGWGDSFRRLLDQRGERRGAAESQSAMLDHAGKRYVVRMIDLSPSGAMVALHATLAEGADVMLQLLDHGAVKGQVRWSRDGRVGISFLAPLNDKMDRE